MKYHSSSCLVLFLPQPPLMHWVTSGFHKHIHVIAETSRGGKRGGLEGGVKGLCVYQGKLELQGLARLWRYLCLSSLVSVLVCSFHMCPLPLSQVQRKSIGASMHLGGGGAGHPDSTRKTPKS